MATTIIEQLEQFVKEAEDSLTAHQWISDDRIYVRKGRHLLQPGTKIACTLDIASVEVEEEHQNQGVWSDFIQKAHELNPWEATQISCAQALPAYFCVLFAFFPADSSRIALARATSSLLAHDESWRLLIFAAASSNLRSSCDMRIRSMYVRTSDSGFLGRPAMRISIATKIHKIKSAPLYIMPTASYNGSN
jgi:hypothetical protein